MSKADSLPPSCSVVTKYGNLNFLEHSGSVMRLIYLLLKYNFSRKSVQWEPICSMWTNRQTSQSLQSLSATLRTRLKMCNRWCVIKNHTAEPEQLESTSRHDSVRTDRAFRTLLQPPSPGWIHAEATSLKLQYTIRLHGVT